MKTFKVTIAVRSANNRPLTETVEVRAFTKREARKRMLRLGAREVLQIEQLKSSELPRLPGNFPITTTPSTFKPKSYAIKSLQVRA